ncbi:MAG: hypothetical protein V1826_01665 [bacterium]
MKIVYGLIVLGVLALIAFGAQWLAPKDSQPAEVAQNTQSELLKQYDAKDDRYRLIDLDQVPSIEWLNENFPVYPATNALSEDQFADRMMIDLSQAKILDTYTVEADPEIGPEPFVDIEVGNHKTKLVLGTGLPFEEINARWESRPEGNGEFAKALLLVASGYEADGGQITVRGQLHDIITVEPESVYSQYS